MVNYDSLMEQFSEELRETLLALLRPHVDSGDYKKALVVTKAWLKRFPDELTTQFQHAKILGDWADELPPAKQKKLKAEAVAILKPLLKKLRGRPLDEQFSLSLNYYYQSKDWRGMSAFGRKFKKLWKQKGIYGESLGATLLSEELLLIGQRARSRTWAAKAVTGWRSYDFRKESYYFPHYSFAKALALNGESKEAMKRLQVAARLGKRKITDWEFADVIALCEPA